MLITANTVIAQSGSLAKNETTELNIENIFVHANNTTLVAGETLHCKFYCLNSPKNNFSSISKIAHVELVNKENQVIFANKIYLENGTGEGDFFIPTTIETGNYKLIAYTNWMLNNKNTKTAVTDLIIINPYIVSTIKKPVSQTQNGQEKNEENQSITTNSSTKDQSFALELNKKAATKREQILLKIKSLNGIANNGSFSLSIRKTNSLPSKKQMNSYEFTKSYSGETINNNSLFLPELRGEVISGSIKNNKDPKQIADKNIALSLPGKDFAFKVVKTNEDGKFNFILEKSPNYSNAIIQVVGEDKNDYAVELDKYQGYNLSELKQGEEFYLSSDYKASLEERSIANQIENSYYHLKKDSIQPEIKKFPFYHPLEKEYILGDYTKFPTLKETTIEVVKEMYYREENKNFTLHVRDINYDLNFFSEPSLVLVDGVLIQNTNELVDLKMDEIYKVSLVPGVYIYGPTAFDGIINFTSKNHDYSTKEKGAHILKTDIQRPLNKITSFKQDYTNKSKYDRVPDYRYQLLWEPELLLDNNEKTISFFTSDVPGQYEINLEGFTKDGVPVSLKESFEVK
ncbi:hypothetical protein SAMN06265349_102485 [Flavobacterium resistens]|uniref:MG2 domain-containing protein n=1 Tax=Flavobacterium resistens TaxID=443612 RepID=A0A521CFI0_9FLAO|nr:hypothetical protein [Flavobacterium resistens]MRX66579.1 hypothetical protein [Flavobacterium resistens]SMO58203.1 hypothetical protein SAMN06265349_102485 [Flavobacterium resistens]